ncbi:MAG: sugar ABC transporter ATP-binding protein [Saprospiraceae bacterium]|nr:sugar ABC transporter ATP-binding protein [Saprospiraceae bacterium]
MPLPSLSYLIDPDEKDRIRLRLKNISKRFPGVLALDQVNFDLKVGEVHAICGENGAGKTTLMNILSGNLQPDEGSIFLHGDEVKITDPQEAQRQGIGIVYQEKSLVGNLSVADNIFAGNQPVSKWHLIDRRKLINQTQQLLRKLGMHDIDAHGRVDKLSPGKQQMVEIAKALSRDPQILILDEPTAAISEQDTKVLFKIVRLMVSQGKSVIYISHRMSEIFEVSDRVTVLKDGKYQNTLGTKDTNVNEIIRLMVGRDIKEFDYQNLSTSEVVLSVSELEGDRFKNISFQLHRSEILGFAGLVGAGRSEIAQSIFGVTPDTGGQVLIRGKKVKSNEVANAIENGLGYLPENRKEQGLFLEMSVEDNISSVKSNTQTRGIFIERKGNAALTEEFVRQLNIKTPSGKTKVVSLSGGNQQKIVLAKWLAVNPDILIVDEPTAGIDVGAKSEIYQLLNQLTMAGTSIIMISSDLPELLGICDRILVFRHGRITADLSREKFSEEEIMHYSSGTKDMYREKI